MIDCVDFSQHFSDYLEGKVSEEYKKLIDAHLAACPNCAKLLANARLVIKSLKSLPKITASEDFNRALRRRLAQEAAKERAAGLERMLNSVRALPVKPIVVTFAAAAIIAFAAVIIETYVISSNEEKVLYSPRIKPPPFPGSGKTAVYQQKPLNTGPMQIGGFNLPDSSSLFFPNRTMDSTLPETIFQSLRDQFQPVKKIKY